jgi:glycerol-3-phosphate dehydrogenase
LGVIDSYFPKAKIKEEDIIASYAGVRPLVDDGSATESKTSREHVILNTPHNVTFVAGGKYTTYRSVARDVMERVLKCQFSLEDRTKFARNQTRDAINPIITVEKLSEAIGQSYMWAREYGLTEAQTLLLAQRHGFEALLILEEGKRAGIKSPWAMEALFASHYTMCLHLKDFMLRRSPLYLSDPQHGFSHLDLIAEVFKMERDWSDEKIQAEKELYFDHIKFEMGWRN